MAPHEDYILRHLKIVRSRLSKVTSPPPGHGNAAVSDYDRSSTTGYSADSTEASDSGRNSASDNSNHKNSDNRDDSDRRDNESRPNRGGSTTSKSQNTRVSDSLK